MLWLFISLYIFAVHTRIVFLEPTNLISRSAVNYGNTANTDPFFKIKIYLIVIYQLSYSHIYALTKERSHFMARFSSNKKPEKFQFVCYTRENFLFPIVRMFTKRTRSSKCATCYINLNIKYALCKIKYSYILS